MDFELLYFGFVDFELLYNVDFNLSVLPSTFVNSREQCAEILD